MKKTFLLIAAAAMLGFASCGGGNGGGGGKTPNLPKEDGKFTVYFTPGAESVELPDYAGYFVTGNFNGWAEEDAPELLPYEGTDYYYAIISVAEDYDWDGEAGLAYKITLGYKADSGAPKTGVSWSYESDVDKSFPYGENPQFVKNGQYLDCGTHSWDSAPGPVVTVTGVTVSVTLSEAAPAWLTFALPGDFNSWSNEAVMTPNEDRTVFSYTIASEIIAGKHEGQMLMYYNDSPSWDNKLLGDKSNNYEFAFSKLHETTGYNYNEEDMELEGDPLVVEFLPDPDALQPVAVTIKIVADAEITADLAISGSFNSWGSEVLFTTEDHINFVVSFSSEDGFMSDSDANVGIHGADGDWHHKIQPETPLFKTLAGDTYVEITLKAGAAEYFNTATEAWDGLSTDLFEVAVSPLLAE